MKNIIKNTNKKGFTIVELVIVIAVIAILAGVLIPTFANVIENANESAALQRATALYKDAYAEAISDGEIAANESVTSGDLKFVFNGTLENIDVKVFKKTTEAITGTPDGEIDGYKVTVNGGVVSVEKSTD